VEGIVDKLVGILKSELLTKLNVVATAILIWITTQPSAPIDKVLAYLPESTHALAAVIAPVLWAVVVQFAIQRLKKQTAEQAVNDLISK
jgi:hypothetical protein